MNNLTHHEHELNDKTHSFFADKAGWVFHHVKKEVKLRPVEEQTLQTVANWTDGARPDFRVMGFTRQLVYIHFDIKMIIAQAKTHPKVDRGQAMKEAEEGMEKAYKERVEKVEVAKFILLIFTTSGAEESKP